MEKNNKIIEKDYEFKKKYFHEIKNIDINKIKITVQGEYSISNTKASDKLVYLIKKYFKSTNLTITDGTGNNGSDTIGLGLNFKHVNSIELDPINFSVLENNVKQVYGLDNVNLFLGDSIQVIPTLRQDVIYMDAPWGGRDYGKESRLGLFLGKYEISDIYNKFKSNTKLFVFKVPKNYDFTHFIQNTLLDKYYIHSFRQGDKVKFYFLFVPCNKN
jgi:predicted RNA methylase